MNSFIKSAMRILVRFFNIRSKCIVPVVARRGISFQGLWSFVGIVIFFFARIISFSLFFIITDDYVNFQEDVLELLICICQLENAFSLSSFPETDVKCLCWSCLCPWKEWMEGHLGRVIWCLILPEHFLLELCYGVCCDMQKSLCGDLRENHGFIPIRAKGTCFCLLSSYELDILDP